MDYDPPQYPNKYRRPKWEGELRMHLATMCMAATAGKEGDLKQATEMVIEWVEDHAAAILAS